MANPVIGELVTEVEAIKQLVPSIVAALTGINARIEAAVAAAIANGATEAELAPVRAVVTDLAAKRTELADAMVANTPAEA